MSKNDWSDGYIKWWNGSTLNISVVFSWQMQKALEEKAILEKQGYIVKIGGPATGIFEPNGEVVTKHNPHATFTSRGCIRKCEFCIVPRIEGNIRELKEWIPRPTVCDNNLLACSSQHFNKVVDSLKSQIGVDFNQGLDSRLLRRSHVSRLTELRLKCVRLAWDSVQYEQDFIDACRLLRAGGIPKSKIRVYVLIGFKDTPEDALYRLETIRAMKMIPFPMRYQPINTPKKNQYIGKHWTHTELVRYMRYWANLRITNPIPFQEFDKRKNDNQGQDQEAQ